jgi:hypothetical protein
MKTEFALPANRTASESSFVRILTARPFCDPVMYTVRKYTLRDKEKKERNSKKT